MARPLRIDYPGAIYHVTARGNAREDIFWDDRDRERFLEYLAKCVETCEARLYFFCLMTNHIHLVLETPGANLGRFMQLLQTSYGHFHNRRHNRVGHLFQGRYKARLVEADEYLNALSRYVHLNPVCVSKLRGKALEERRAALRSYSWSSFPGYVRESCALPFVDYGPVLSGFGKRRSLQSKAYRDYVESGIANRDGELEEVLRKPWPAIGGDRFRAWVMDLHDKLLKGHGVREDVGFRKERKLLSEEAVLGKVAEELKVRKSDLTRRRRGTYDRGIAARMLSRYAGLTQREVAKALGLGSGAAVGWQLRSVEEAIAKDRGLRGRVERVERVMEECRKRASE